MCIRMTSTILHDLPLILRFYLCFIYFFVIFLFLFFRRRQKQTLFGKCNMKIKHVVAMPSNLLHIRFIVDLS